MSRDKERQKQIQDKCQNLLNSMLRDDDNKYCVDCDAKGPRWASWNLGIFLCIRCAGIHRNLGVHISKVKSVNLDSWTPEQVVSLQQMGNSRARAVYEANLPDSFRRPQTDSALESFIRAKYEAKKYIAHEWVPAPLPKVDWEKELEEEAEKNRKKKREIKSTVPIGIPKKTEVIPQAIPKPTSSPKTGGRPGRRSVPEPVASATADLLALDTPSDTASSEDFSGFLSAPGTVEPKVRSEEEESFFSQSTPSVPAGNSGKLTTDSILALYSKAPLNVPAQHPIYAGSGGSFSGAPFQQPAVQGPSNPFFSLQRPAFQPAGAPFQAAGAPFQYQGFQQPPLVQPVQDSLSENLRNLELGTNQNGLPNQSFFCK